MPDKPMTPQTPETAAGTAATETLDPAALLDPPEGQGLTPKKKALLALGGVVVVLLLGLLFWRQGYLTVKPIETFGAVTLDRGGQTDIPLVTNMSLQAEDTMRTGEEGSFCRLVLDGDKYVYVEEESEVAFALAGRKGSGRITLHLNQGAVINELESPLTDKEEYHVKTPNALLAVRGTRFRVSAYTGTDGIFYTRISVLEGEVECRLVYPDGSLSEESQLATVANEALIYYDEWTEETDFVRQAPFTGLLQRQEGETTWPIRYHELPTQPLQFLYDRTQEGVVYEAISAEGLYRYLQQSLAGEEREPQMEELWEEDLTLFDLEENQDADLTEEPEGGTTEPTPTPVTTIGSTAPIQVARPPVTAAAQPSTNANTSPSTNAGTTPQTNGNTSQPAAPPTQGASQPSATQPGQTATPTQPDTPQTTQPEPVLPTQPGTTTQPSPTQPQQPGTSQPAPAAPSAPSNGRLTAAATVPEIQAVLDQGVAVTLPQRDSSTPADLSNLVIPTDGHMTVTDETATQPGQATVTQGATVVAGDLTGKELQVNQNGEAQITGTLHGDVSVEDNATLQVGPEGKIEGNLYIDGTAGQPNAQVAGTVTGQVVVKDGQVALSQDASRVILQGGATVTAGDSTLETLTLEPDTKGSLWVTEGHSTQIDTATVSPTSALTLGAQAGGTLAIGTLEADMEGNDLASILFAGEGQVTIQRIVVAGIACDAADATDYDLAVINSMLTVEGGGTILLSEDDQGRPVFQVVT